jgi:hypothetical protein
MGFPILPLEFELIIVALGDEIAGFGYRFQQCQEVCNRLVLSKC